MIMIMNNESIKLVVILTMLGLHIIMFILTLPQMSAKH